MKAVDHEFCSFLHVETPFFQLHHATEVLYIPNYMSSIRAPSSDFLLHQFLYLFWCGYRSGGGLFWLTKAVSRPSFRLCSRLITPLHSHKPSNLHISTSPQTSQIPIKMPGEKRQKLLRFVKAWLCCVLPVCTPLPELSSPPANRPRTSVTAVRAGPPSSCRSWETCRWMGRWYASLMHNLSRPSLIYTGRRGGCRGRGAEWWSEVPGGHLPPPHHARQGLFGAGAPRQEVSFPCVTPYRRFRLQEA